VTENQALDSDEIDLLALLRSLLRHKLSIFMLTLLFGVGALGVALTTPNTYQAEVLISSSQNKSGGGLSALASQYGSMAALAGIDLGSGDTGLESAMALLQSRKFIISMIEEENLKPVLFPKSWDSEAKVWMQLPPSMVSRIKNIFATEIKPVDLTPSDLAAFKAFNALLSVSKNKLSGLVTIKMESEDPQWAAYIANKIIIRLNEYLRNEAILQSDSNIRYLEQEIADTPLVEFKTALYELVESESRNKMFANVNKEYAFKVIDPALVPEQAVKPKRALILVLGVMLGFMLGCAQALIRAAIIKQ
jgi:uncharacterized protein involved in exopolysaccharide biosynthesis